ncbi:MAG: metallophosphoesterase family protein [Anaerolineales bacterium]
MPSHRIIHTSIGQALIPIQNVYLILLTIGTFLILASAASTKVKAAANSNGAVGGPPRNPGLPAHKFELMVEPRRNQIVLENINPSVTIDLMSGSTYNLGNSVYFTGSAEDIEDGDLSSNLVWSSNIDGPIGFGASFSRSDLSAGVHTITASVTDSGGFSGSGTITITIFEDAPILVGAGDIADAGSNHETTAKLLEEIPGTIFTTGDSVYPNGTSEEFQTYYDPTWGRHKSRTRPTPGNHDYGTPDAAAYYAYFGSAAGDPGKGYYSYNIGDWHIIALNTQCSEVGGCGENSPQGKWLQEDLSANQHFCTLAYFHYGLYSSSNPSDAAQYFWDLLYQAGVDVVLNGHAHNYERFAPQDPHGNFDPERGIRQFEVGTGGADLHLIPGITAPNSEVSNDATYGVLKLTLNSTSYDWEFIPVDGMAFTDSGSTECISTGTIKPPQIKVVLPLVSK